MRAAYTRAAALDDVVRRAGELSARTMIFDVEPLVAYWNGGQDALDEGVTRVLSEVAVLPAVEVVCFATNSVRRPSSVPGEPGVRVIYLASAGKPLRTTPYRGFCEPAVGAVLAPDGIPAAVVHLGGPPGLHAALTARAATRHGGAPASQA